VCDTHRHADQTRSGRTCRPSSLLQAYSGFELAPISQLVDVPLPPPRTHRAVCECLLPTPLRYRTVFVCVGKCYPLCVVPIAGSVFVYLPTTNKQTERLFTSPSARSCVTAYLLICSWDFSRKAWSFHTKTGQTQLNPKNPVRITGVFM
jgi:hypothetical protein